MVSDARDIISLHVNQIMIAQEDIECRFPAAHIGLMNFTFSCHKDIGEQSLSDLILILERRLRAIVMNAYNRSSERIAG